jgi:hypothetical protein
MPGPKMGVRPADFDEDVIRQSPTFMKWARLELGEKLKYACREFVKGHAEDEERLMRRIMIARRNNLRDHETLKKARQRTASQKPKSFSKKESSSTSKRAKISVSTQAGVDQKEDEVAGHPPQGQVARLPQSTIGSEEEADPSHWATSDNTVPRTSPAASKGSKTVPTTGTNLPPGQHGEDNDEEEYLDADMEDHSETEDQHSTNEDLGGFSPASLSARRRRPASLFNDDLVSKEMDVPAVEATRSYKNWADLPIGYEFIYNQKYIKGREGHDWLLRKNIWRRMRYRRENKKMVERMKSTTSPPPLAFKSEGMSSDRTGSTANADGGGSRSSKNPMDHSSSHQETDPSNPMGTNTTTTMASTGTTAPAGAEGFQLGRTTEVSSSSRDSSKPPPPHSLTTGIATTTDAVTVAAAAAAAAVAACTATEDEDAHNAAVVAAVAAASSAPSDDLETAAAVEAAVAVAESYAKSSSSHASAAVRSETTTMAVTHNPLEGALDAAARLAAATTANTIAAATQQEEEEAFSHENGGSGETNERKKSDKVEVKEEQDETSGTTDENPFAVSV